MTEPVAVPADGTDDDNDEVYEPEDIATEMEDLGDNPETLIGDDVEGDDGESA